MSTAVEAACDMPDFSWLALAAGERMCLDSCCPCMSRNLSGPNPTGRTYIVVEVGDETRQQSPAGEPTDGSAA